MNHLDELSPSPWFQNDTTIDAAAKSIFAQFQNAVKNASPEVEARSFIAETGWPSDADGLSYGGSQAGVANMQS